MVTEGGKAVVVLELLQEVNLTVMGLLKEERLWW